MLEDILDLYYQYVTDETEYLVHAVNQFQNEARGTAPRVYYSMRARAEFSDILLQLGREHGIR